MRLIDKIVDPDSKSRWFPPGWENSKFLEPEKLIAEAETAPRSRLSEIRAQLQAEFTQATAGWGKKFRDSLRGAVVIIADNVSEFFFQTLPDKVRHLDDLSLQSILSVTDLPNIRPPFQKMWIEVHDETGYMGALIETTELLSITATFIYETRGRTDLLPYARVKYQCSPQGDLLSDSLRIEGCKYIQNEAEANDPTRENGSVALWLPVILLTISFMHCKNVEMRPSPPTDRALAKRRAQRGHPPFVKFHTLCIDPMRKILRNATSSGTEEDALRRALHICRGHFRTYTPDAPLFGRTVGTFYVQQHVRGNAEHGVIVKDYKVANDGPP